MAHKSDDEIVRTTHNTARFFTENRSISWVLLIGVILWGIYGYMNIPKRKDPYIPVRQATAVTPWPGVSAEKVEQLVTRPVEEKIAGNSAIHKPGPTEFGIKSTTLPGLSIVQIQLGENISDTQKEFNNINLRLNSLNDSLPQGAGPIQFNSGFGETAALMLTVASPKESSVEISLRAREIRKAIEQVRSLAPHGKTDTRMAVVAAFPKSDDTQIPARMRDILSRAMAYAKLASDILPIRGPGYVGLDANMHADKKTILAFVHQFTQSGLGLSGIYPDVWPPVVIRDPKETESELARVAGDKYSYAALDDITGLIQRVLLTVPQVSKIQRSGVLPERVYLSYSQERLASYGVQPSNIKAILNARNITLPGGVLQVGDNNLIIDPSGQFTSAKQIGDVIITNTSAGTPVYLRDLVSIYRGYQSPPTFLNFYTYKDAKGKWHRTRAITLAVQMRAGEQIGEFGKNIDAAITKLKQDLPDGLIIAKTSDQPRQVRENIDLFMTALYEAIALVVLVSLLGFWEWRSALLMAICIPITLAITFGMIFSLGIDLQQVSIATLIIALGLLVDDPIVAGDAIKRDLAEGHPSLVSAWLGPTKLAKAIMFATITNIAAYLPFLLLPGNTGTFLRSLAIVMACTLIASRLVSMTFLPLLGYYLLRPSKRAERSIEERSEKGFTGFYYKVGHFAVDHRWLVFLSSLVFLGLGIYEGKQLKTSFFPDDVQYLSYLDIRLPESAPLSSTNDVAIRAQKIVEEVTAEYGKEHPDKNNKPREILKSVTTFIGGSSPRFWFSLTPQLSQLNYAQLIIEVKDKNYTPQLVAPLQRRLSAEIAGARVDVRQLQTNPVEVPIAIRISGRADINTLNENQDIRTLRSLADQVKGILRPIRTAGRIHDDWGSESFVVKLQVDPDLANESGVTNQDVATSSTAAMNGIQVTTLREGDKQIPVLVRLLPDERAKLSDIQNLYIYSLQSQRKVPFLEISSLKYNMQTEKICRLEHFRTITVQGFPDPGSLPSEVMRVATPRLKKLEKSLPPGYNMTIGGEQAKQTRGFRNLMMVLAISVAAIFLGLVFQFNNAVKPFLVFAAVPYGAVGALTALDIMNEPFGFMAFLGIASLVGVIVSHVIVLFDFIEMMHEKGEPLRESLLQAGIIRLRPVMITVGATVLALFPLAMHGGPLWQPLCYAQIGGLALATFIELLLVPVLYAIFVLDLKIVKWETKSSK